MRKLFEKLLWPNLWFGVFSLLAFLGAICLLVGHFAGLPRLKIVGIWLGLPLVAGAVILVVVIIPILLFANRKHRKQAKGSMPENRE